MKIVIEQILSNGAIGFSSKFGKGIAIWRDKEPQCKEYESKLILKIV